MDLQWWYDEQVKSKTGVTVGLTLKQDSYSVPSVYYPNSASKVGGPSTYTLDVTVPGSYSQTNYRYTELPNFSDAMEVLNQIMNNHPELQPKEKTVDSTKAPNYIWNNTTNSPGITVTNTDDDIDIAVTKRIREILGEVSDEDLANELLDRLPDNVLIMETVKRLKMKEYTGPDFPVFDADEDKWNKKDDGLWYCEGTGDDGDYSRWTWEQLFGRYEVIKDENDYIVNKDGTLRD